MYVQLDKFHQAWIMGINILEQQLGLSSHLSLISVGLRYQVQLLIILELLQLDLQERERLNQLKI